jgi:hypothetical protein
VFGEGGGCANKQVHIFGMGSSFSAPSYQSPTLPVELVINILSCVSLYDLVSCRLVNRNFNDIIDSSECLQHQIDTAVAGVMDNPRSTLSLRARRNALAQRQEAWDTCQPRSTTSIRLGITPKNDGRETLLRLNTLREQGAYTILSLAVCDDNDLIAMGSLSSPINFAVHDPYQVHLHSLEVDLLRISCGGGEHPAAGKSTLYIKGSLGNPRWEEMKIHGNLLAVHLEHIKSSLYDLPDSELWLFDWKAGDNLAVGSTSPANDQSLTYQIKVLEGRRN